jgi:hypothetical protein
MIWTRIRENEYEYPGVVSSTHHGCSPLQQLSKFMNNGLPDTLLFIF